MEGRIRPAGLVFATCALGDELASRLGLPPSLSGGRFADVLGTRSDLDRAAPEMRPLGLGASVSGSSENRDTSAQFHSWSWIRAFGHKEGVFKDIL